MRNNLRALLAASVSLWVMTAAAQDESRPDESSKVGEVNFAVSCGLPAQQKSTAPSRYCIPFGTRRREALSTT